MLNFVKLKSGVAIPEKSLMENAIRIRSIFDTRPGPIMKLVMVANHNFDEGLVQEHLSDEYYRYLFETMYEFHLGPLRQNGRIRDRKMARTALAMNMIVVNHEDGDLDGYLQEPLLSDREILDEVHRIQQTSVSPLAETVASNL